MAKRCKNVGLCSMLTALLLFTGLLKLPSLFSGAEFQLSAPFAVAIASVFGVRRYLVCGVLASVAGFLLGFQNLFGVAVALSFRGGVALLLLLFGSHKLVLILAGPIGTLCGRLVLSFLTGVPFLPLLALSFFGMLCTVVLVLPLTKLLSRVAERTGFGDCTNQEESLLLRLLQAVKGRGESDAV